MNIILYRGRSISESHTFFQLLYAYSLYVCMSLQTRFVFISELHAVDMEGSDSSLHAFELYC